LMRIATSEKSLQAAPLLACRNHECCLARMRACFRSSPPGHRVHVLRTNGERTTRLLTVEKTVIRFRPADVSCRSE
jgi:hypothetical protein